MGVDSRCLVSESHCGKNLDFSPKCNLGIDSLTFGEVGKSVQQEHGEVHPGCRSVVKWKAEVGAS